MHCPAVAYQRPPVAPSVLDRQRLVRICVVAQLSKRVLVGALERGRDLGGQQPPPVSWLPAPEVTVTRFVLQLVERHLVDRAVDLVRAGSAQGDCDLGEGLAGASGQPLEPNTCVEARRPPPLDGHSEQRSRARTGGIGAERFRAGVGSEQGELRPPCAVQPAGGSRLVLRELQDRDQHVERMSREDDGRERPTLELLDQSRGRRPVELQGTAFGQPVPVNGRRGVGGQIAEVVHRAEQAAQPHVPRAGCTQDRDARGRWLERTNFSLDGGGDS